MDIRTEVIYATDVGGATEWIIQYLQYSDNRVIYLMVGVDSGHRPFLDP